MKSEWNDMDQWLQQAADNGSVPMPEADWEQMKELLQPKKKRRIIFWWWLCAAILVGGAIIYWSLVNRHSSSSDDTGKGLVTITEEKNSAGNKEINTNESTSDADNAEDPKTTINTINQNNHNNDTASSNKIIPAQDPGTTINAPIIVDKKSLAADRNNGKNTGIKKNSTQQQVNDDGDLSSINNSNGNTTQSDDLATKRKGNASTGATGDAKQPIVTNSDDASTQKKAAQRKKLKDPQTLTNNVIDSVAANDLSKNQQRKPLYQLQAAAIPGMYPIIPFVSFRGLIQLSDSIAMKKVDSVEATKPPLNKRNEWLIAGGYYTGNIPMSSNGWMLRVNYRYHVGQFFIQPSVGLSQFATRDNQHHEAIRSDTILGTTSSLVTEYSTSYKPTAWAILQPSLSVGYQWKQWSLSAGWQQNILLGKDRKDFRTAISTTRFDSIAPHIIPTPRIDSTSPVFSASKSSALVIGLRYNFHRKWSIGIEMNRVLRYNEIQGVIERYRKRSSFGLSIGYRF